MIAHPVVQRLGWTLVHFVWAGASVAVLLSGALWLLRKRTANARYLAGCIAMAVMAALFMVTMWFVPILPTATPVDGADRTAEASAQVFSITPLPASPIDPSAVPPESTAGPPLPWTTRISNLLEPHLLWIVAGWLAGVLVLSIRLLGGWAQAQRLKRRLVKPASESCQEMLKRLSQRLRVSRPVRLLESALAKVPTAIGWLRPVILIPASALTGLSSKQLEAVLAHELAHIRRHDYLVNLVQTVIETLLFYHPAVWWVSHRIRIERENCCDDLAVSVCGDAATYARALTELEQLRGVMPRLAVAATGGSLINRIRRLVGVSTDHRNRSAWLFAGTIALVTVISLGIAVQVSVLSASAAETEEELSENEKNIQALKQKLDQTIVTLDLTNADMREVFDFISTAYDVNLVIDDRYVRVAQRRPYSSLPIAESSGIDPVIPAVKVTNVPLSTALKTILTPKGLDYRVEPHFVFVSEPSVLEEGSIVKELLVEPNSDDMVHKLKESRVDLDFMAAHLRAVLDFVSNAYDVKVVLDETIIPAWDGSQPVEIKAGIPDAVTSMVVYLRLENVPLRDTLKGMLIPMNLDYKVFPDHVFVSTPARLEAGAEAPSGSNPAPASTPPSAEEDPPKPEQQETTADIERILDETRVDLDFSDAALREVIDFIAVAHQVNIVLDDRYIPLAPKNLPTSGMPTVAGHVNPMIPEIRMEDVTLRSALKGILIPRGLDFRVEPHFVFVSIPSVLQQGSIMTNVAVAPNSEDLHRTLQEERLDLKFEDAPLREVAAFLSDAYGVNIVLDDRVIPLKKPVPVFGSGPRDPNEITSIVPTLRLANLPLRDTLKALFIPRGLDYKVFPDFVFVSTPAVLTEQIDDQLNLSRSAPPGPPRASPRPQSARPRAVPRPPIKRPWGPEQATGEPDTLQAGNSQTAWASLNEDDQLEWLILRYAEPVDPASLKIYETHNPGAVNKVSVFNEQRREVEVWTGKDPTPASREMGISDIPIDVTFKTDRIKIYLDSPKVPGWNEIDAVGIVDKAGQTHWADAAGASSTYAERAGKKVWRLFKVLKVQKVRDSFRVQVEFENKRQWVEAGKVLGDYRIDRVVEVKDGEYKVDVYSSVLKERKTYDVPQREPFEELVTRTYQFRGEAADKFMDAAAKLEELSPRTTDLQGNTLSQLTVDPEKKELVIHDIRSHHRLFRSWLDAFFRQDSETQPPSAEEDPAKQEQQDNATDFEKSRRKSQFLNEGFKYYIEKRYQEALEMFRQVLILDEDNEVAQDYERRCQEILAGGEPEEINIYFPEEPVPSPETEEWQPLAERQVERYMQEGQEHFEAKEYDDAITAWENALIIDPDVPEARENIRDARLEHLKERRRDLFKKLRQISGREFVLTNEKKEIERILDEELIDIDFTNADIRQVINFIAGAYSVNIIIDDRYVAPSPESASTLFEDREDAWAMFESPFAVEGRKRMNQGKAIDPIIPFVRLTNVPLRDALKALLNQKGLDFKVESHFIWVSIPKVLQHETFEDLVTKYYYFGEEVDVGIEMVAEVEKTIPEVWDSEGNVLSYVSFNSETKQLLVHTTLSNHTKITEILERLPGRKIGPEVENEI